MNKFLFNLKYNEPLGKKFPKYAISQSEYTRLNSEESAVAWAKKYYGDWSQQYCNIYGHSSLTGGTIKNYIESDNSSDPIRFYCGYEGSKLNRFLRGMKDWTTNLKNYNDVLSTLLLHSPRLPENIVTYRFVPDEAIQDILQANKEERVFTDPAFLSTCLLNSKPLKNSEFDYNKVLEIYVDKGTACVYTNLIRGCHRGEIELLVLKNATMYLIDYPYKKDGKTFYPIRLKNIPDQNYLW